MRPAVPPLLAIVALAIPAIGCGSSVTETSSNGTAETPAPSQTPQQSTQADEAIAHAALLRLSDLPVGWTAAPDDSSDAHCPAIDDAEQHPHEESLRFDGGGDQAAQHEAIVLATEEEADATLQALVSQDTLDCIAEQTEQTIRQQASAATQVGDVTAAQLNVSASGDRTAAARVTIPVTANGLDVEVYEDFVFSRVDRGLSLIALIAQGSQPDDALRAQLTERGAARMRRALGSS